MSVFKFKQFEVQQSLSSQKIGTDSVLLGSWCASDFEPSRILDVGAGTGVISLMLAQRFPYADIDAVELDEAAHEEATINFENSNWADRLFCYHASFQEFYEDDDEFEFYDLIVSNPPYFDASSIGKPSNNAREMARFDDNLPFEELIYGVYKTLSKNGTFACIIPSDRENHLLNIATHFGLIPTRVTEVKGNENSKVKRCLIELRFRESENNNLIRNTIVVEKERHVYTEDSKKLFEPFYLKL